jgi:hypothetical protein
MAFSTRLWIIIGRKLGRQQAVGHLDAHLARRSSMRTFRISR